jgi:dienelactone hydrolase
MGGAAGAANHDDGGMSEVGGTVDGGMADAEVIPSEPVIPDRAAIQSAGCPAEEPAARVLFDIPRAGDVSGDFFRLPYPNDIRFRDGHLFLSDFPRPFAFPGLDILDKVVRGIESEHLGYGPNPVVTFRLSRTAAFDAATGSAAPGAVRFVDLTEGAAEYGTAVAHRLATMTPGMYLCARHLLVLRDSGTPLLGGHTYAVVLTSALLDQDGQAFARDTDFRVMLAASAPTGPERLAAWTAYAPLRRWLGKDAALAKSTVAAAVFTVDGFNPAAQLRAAVATGAAPAVKDLVRCGPGVASVCDDGRTKGCASASESTPFVEYQGRLEMPVFQQGTPPFDTAGGGISYDGNGTPVVARRELVCFSLTVPKGAAGAGGWPVVLYGHGTGGHFRWPVESGLAAELAAGNVDDGARAPMAVLGFDGVLHGPRKGDSTRATDELVYNVMNPTASRDNGLQAAADLFAFARALPQLISAERPLDMARIGLYGHSQGGNAAAVAAGYEPTFGAVVLSGTGGGIATSLLEKQKPVSAASLLPLLVGEAVSQSIHPAMQMMQLYFDRADPLNHGRRIAAAPMPGVAARHVLHVLGSGDNYAPVSTQLAFAAGAELPVLHPVLPLGALGHLNVITGPVRMNFGIGAGRTTALEAQFDPNGYDGHFVSTLNPAAQLTIRRFLGSYFRDDMPVVE